MSDQIEGVEIWNSLKKEGEMSYLMILYAAHMREKDEEDSACVFAAYTSLEKHSCQLIYPVLHQENQSLPVLITHCPSSLIRTHWLASSNSKSWRSSTRFAYSGSALRLRFRCLASHSGSGRAVDEPEIVYTGTAELLESFIPVVISRISNFQERES